MFPVSWFAGCMRMRSDSQIYNLATKLLQIQRPYHFSLNSLVFQFRLHTLGVPHIKPLEN